MKKTEHSEPNNQTKQKEKIMSMNLLFMLGRWVKGSGDPWEGSETYFVGRFRVELEEVARILSKKGLPLHVRFNSKKECAEIHFESGHVLFQVDVNGGQEGLPCEAVFTATSFTEETEYTIRKIFPSDLHIEFKHP